MPSINPDKWQEVKEICYAALQLPPAERERFLDESCADDEDLRREVESLLSSSEDAGSFMQNAAVGEVAREFAGAKSNPQVKQNLGHYKILKLLGAGGMGEVYLAEDQKLDRRVAVKILNEKFERDEANLRRFIREAKAASALNHPNILTIYEIGESEDAHFIVSEYVEGETLREVLLEKTLTLAEILDISVQNASALAAAHAAHIVHRDIKPENIMIRPDGLAKILDFGLAKLVEEKNKSLTGAEDATARQNETAKGVILGTVNYMSPEQAKGERVDGRTDIFSFGVLLYEMIAGRTPFAGGSVSETLANLIHKEPPPIADFAADAPDELQRIIEKMLRKNKDERYQTMKDLLADLKRLKENIAFDEKSGRSAAPGENATRILPATTRDLQQQTAATQNSFQAAIKQKPFAVAAALLFLTFAVAATLFYFTRGNVSNQPPSIDAVNSLAVLPLKSLDAGDNYLGLGIADAVIRRINQTGKLIVRPTSAVRRYLNEDTDALTAARQLQTDAVLEGSVQRAGDRLRVSVNLLRTADGASLWTDNFDMRTTDIFTIQDSVAQQVATRLRLRLDSSQQAELTKRYTSNPIAYEFYLKGVYNLDQRISQNKPQAEITIDFFKKAIAADPNFALAHAQLAYAYALMAAFVEPTETAWAQRAREEINRAQTLDPQLAEPHIARFQLLYSASENYQVEAAVREVMAAQQLNPNVGHAELGYLYIHIGLEDFAAREFGRAAEIDPTSEYVKQQTLNMYLISGRYDEWLAAQQKLYPDTPLEIWYLLGKGRLAEAQERIEATQKAIEAGTARPLDVIELPRFRALLFALKGDFRAAEAEIPAILSKFLVKEPNYHHAAYDIACIYALEGKTGEAVKWLRETVATGFQPYPLFERDAYLNRIRQTPEFIQFMTEMKGRNEKYRRELT